MSYRPYRATVRGIVLDDDHAIETTFTVHAGNPAQALRRALDRAVLGYPEGRPSLRHPFLVSLEMIGYRTVKPSLWVRGLEPNGTVDAETGSWVRLNPSLFHPGTPAHAAALAL